MSRITLGRRADGSFGFVMTHGGLSVTTHLPLGTQVEISKLPARLGVGETALATIVDGHRQKMIRFDGRASDQDVFLSAIGVGVTIRVVAPFPRFVVVGLVAARLRMKCAFA